MARYDVRRWEPLHGQIAEADEPLTNDPLALLIGMVLDQRVSEGWSGTDLASV